MQQLSGHDASFLYLETPNAPMSGGGLYIYDQSTAPDGKVTFKGILRHIESRLHLAPSFRQKLVTVPLGLDHPYWVEDRDFDLEYHVRHVALPAPGDWRQLCIQVARIVARPLDLSRPLWEFYVIEGLDNVEGVPPGSFALLISGHHASMDGKSGMEMISAIHDASPDEEPPPPATRWEPEREPSPWELLNRAAVNNVRSPMRLPRVLGRTLGGLGRLPGPLMRRQAALPPRNVPRTIFNAPVSPHRVIDGVRLELADVKRVRSAVRGATVNDVLLATVGGGIRAYLGARDELPAESLVAMVPVSVRDPSEEGAGGNHVSAMFVSLATTIADPVERLSAVQDATARSKALNNAIGARTLTELTTVVPGALAGLATRLSTRTGLTARGGLPYNTVVTNVPGPTEPLYFAGAELVTFYGIGMIHDGMGLMNVINSYLGQVIITINSDREMMPDPAFYADCLRGSFAELVDAVG